MSEIEQTDLVGMDQEIGWENTQSIWLSKDGMVWFNLKDHVDWWTLNITAMYKAKIILYCPDHILRKSSIDVTFNLSDPPLQSGNLHGHLDSYIVLWWNKDYLHDRPMYEFYSVIFLYEY